MATKKAPPTKKAKADKPTWKVYVRYHLYVDGTAGKVIAGARLLKGDTKTKPCPEIDFASDTPEEAEQNRKKLEVYLNSL